MKLFYSPTSPFVRKVMVAAIETGLDARIERVTTNPWGADAALIEANPLSKVPTLVTDDGWPLFDSPVIVEYLDTLHHQQRLIPAEGAGRWYELRLQALADGVLDAAILRFLERKREPARQSPEWDQAQRLVVERALAVFEREVEDWPAAIGIGAITAGCALGYLDFRFASEDWRRSCPALAHWFEEFSRRPSMCATLPKVL